MRTLAGLAAALAVVLSACGAGPDAPQARPAKAQAAPSIVASVTRAVIAQPTPTLIPPPVPFVSRLQPPEVHAVSAVVLDERSGAVVYDLRSHDRLPPASLTKIATAAVALEAGALDTVIEVHPDLGRELEQDSSTMGLEPGDKFSVRELLYGLLLPSGNDAAEALAEQVEGGEPAFVARMNGLAAKLHLADTHFTDVHGLGGRDHYSSAYDMALLARYAMTFDTFATIVGSESHTAVGSRSIDLINLNPLLGYTAGVDGVKTGFTEEAGKTFVVSATRQGHRIYVVLFNDAFRAQDAIALIEWSFASLSWQ